MNRLFDHKEYRYLLLAAGLGLAAILGWLIYRPASIPVETAKADIGEILVTLDGEGRTRFVDKVTVTAPVTGLMSRIRLREGDPLPKGYQITQIDPHPPQSRPPTGYDSGPIAAAWKVYTPISGRLLKIWEPNERFVAAGTPIIDIGNAGRTEIVVDVLSTDAGSIKPGATVLIEQAGTYEQLRARVNSVEPQAFTKVSALGVEEQRVNVIVDNVPPELAAGDGYRVDLRFVIWRGHDVLRIPSSALFRIGSDWSVFVKEGGKVYIRQITVGHIGGSMVEVLEGLSEGEAVVLHPSNQLADGARVHEE